MTNRVSASSIRRFYDWPQSRSSRTTTVLMHGGQDEPTWAGIMLYHDVMSVVPCRVAETISSALISHKLVVSLALAMCSLGCPEFVGNHSVCALTWQSGAFAQHWHTRSSSTSLSCWKRPCISHATMLGPTAMIIVSSNACLCMSRRSGTTSSRQRGCPDVRCLRHSHWYPNGVKWQHDV